MGADELGEIGRLLPGLGLVGGGHIEIKAHLQAGRPGFLRVFPEPGVLRQPVARPDIDHLFPIGLDLHKVNLSLPDAHVQPSIFRRPRAHRKDRQGHQQQEGEASCHPFHSIHHNFLWDRPSLCRAAPFGDRICRAHKKASCAQDTKETPKTRKHILFIRVSGVFSFRTRKLSFTEEKWAGIFYGLISRLHNTA